MVHVGFVLSRSSRCVRSLANRHSETEKGRGKTTSWTNSWPSGAWRRRAAVWRRANGRSFSQSEKVSPADIIPEEFHLKDEKALSHHNEGPVGGLGGILFGPRSTDLTKMKTIQTVHPANQSVWYHWHALVIQINEPGHNLHSNGREPSTLQVSFTSNS